LSCARSGGSPFTALGLDEAALYPLVSASPLLLCILPSAPRGLPVLPFRRRVRFASHRAEGGTSCFARNDPLAMGDTERLQRGGSMVVGAGMEGTSPKAPTSSIFSFCLFLNFPVEFRCWRKGALRVSYLLSLLPDFNSDSTDRKLYVLTCVSSSRL